MVSSSCRGRCETQRSPVCGTDDELVVLLFVFREDMKNGKISCKVLSLYSNLVNVDAFEVTSFLSLRSFAFFFLVPLFPLFFYLYRLIQAL